MATWKAPTLVEDGIDRNAAAVEPLTERGVVALEVGLARRVVVFDDAGCDQLFGHVVLPIRPCSAGEFVPVRGGAWPNYRVKLCALPASTLTMLPVDFADMSETKKKAASAMSSG